MGLLAAAGVTLVKVYPLSTVAVLSTWDELVEPTAGTLGHGQIRDSNRAMLVAAVMQQQCKVVDLGIVRDDRKELERVLDEALSSGVDIILTSGGVSMGDRDFIKPFLKEKGKVHFSKVLMKPGKPLMFGLPGNPVSSLVCFSLSVVPTIRQLAGWTSPHQLRVQARLQDPIKSDPIRPEFHRAIIKWKDNDGSGTSG